MDIETRVTNLEGHVADMQAVLVAMRTEAAANMELIKARLAQQDEAIRALADDMRTLMSEVTRLRTEFQEFKTEVRVAFQKFNTEMQVGFQVGRTEVQVVRTEMQVIRTEIQVVRTETQEVRTETQNMRGDFERSLNALTWKMIGAMFALHSVTLTVVY
jgi:chromosome segregation ATPase